MFSHISFGVRDLERAARFYDAVLASLGHVRVWESPKGVGFGLPGKGDKLALFAKSGGPTAPAPEFHLAFDAPNRAAVDAFHSAGLLNGGRDAGGPGLRVHYSPTYYAAFVIDPDGHKLEAVYQSA